MPRWRSYRGFGTAWGTFLGVVLHLFDFGRDLGNARRAEGPIVISALLGARFGCDVAFV